MLFGFLVFGVGISLVSGLHVVHAQTDQVVDASTLQNNANTVALALILNAITYILNLVVAALGKLTLLMIQILIIPILNYNSFSTSPIIGLGWSLVRDVMNMFVIVALIFIAIFTIVGNHRAHWEQQLPQLFIAVVFMNFSRTICGILIDISQVIMFTFVNALLDIAAGNFAQLFQLPDFGKYNLAAVESALKNGTSVAEPFKQFMEAFLQVPLYMSIFAILFLLALAFLYRIVVLWVLVILSPLAFFLGGIKGIFQHADAGKWWKQFTGALLMGPILAFFLWLALAAASSGSIAESEAFPLPQDADTYFSIQALDSSHLTSLLLALILLMVGMQVAGEQSSNLGGLASQVINEGMGRRVVTGSFTLPLRAGRAAAGAAGRGIDYYGAKALGSDKTLREGIGGSLMKAGVGLGKNSGVIGGYLGEGLVSAGASIEHGGEHLREGYKKAAKERVAGMTDEQKVRMMQLARDGKGGTMTREDMRELQSAFTTDKKFQDEAKHLLGEAPADALLANTLVSMNKDLPKMDDATKSKFLGNLTKNAAAVYDSGKDGKEIIEKLVKSNDLDMSKLYNNKKAFEHKEIRDLFADRPTGETRKDKDGNVIPISILDKAEKGGYGQEVRDALSVGAKTRATAAERAQAQQSYTDLRNAGDVGAMKKALNEKAIGLENVKVEDVQGARGKALVQAIATSDVNINALGSGESDPARKTQITQEFINNIVTEQDAGTISSALSSGKMAPNDIPASAFSDAAPARQVELVRGVIGAKSNVGAMGDDAQKAFMKAVVDMREKGSLNNKDVTVAHNMLLGAGKELKDVLPNVNLDPQKPSFSSQDRAYLAQLLKTDAANARHLAPSITQATAPNEVTKLVVENTKSSDIDGLADAIEKAQGKARADLRQTLETIAKAVDLQRAAPPPPLPPGGTPTAKQQESFLRVRDLHDQIQTTLGTLPKT